MAAPLKITLHSVQHEDIRKLAAIGGSAFVDDRHTLLKEQGKVPYDHEGESIPRLHGYLENFKVITVKAVDETGTIVGWHAVAFRGLEAHEIPYLDGAPPRIEGLGDKFWKDQNALDEEPKKDEEAKSGDQQEKVESAPAEGNDESLNLLASITDGNMTDMAKNLMPPGTRCMFLVGLNVDPKYHRQGVGLKLLQWGTDIADKLGLWVWVHSSEMAEPAYAKAGYKTFCTLGVDLDEFAPAPPPKELGIGEKWGPYTFSYMRYFPKKSESV